MTDNGIAKKLAAGLLLLVFISLFASAPALAAEQFDRSKYVPRQEYEELKRRFEDVVRRLEKLEKQQAAPVAGAGSKTPAAGKTAAAKQARAAAPAPAPPKAAEPPAKRAFIPGYEAARIRRLALPNQPPPMNARIARVGDMDLFIGFDSVGRLQYLTQDNVWINGQQPSGLQAGFQTPFANVSFLAQFEDIFDVYFDFYMSSRPHPDYMQGGQGYMLFKGLPKRLKEYRALDWFFHYMDVKAGAFEIDYGDAHYRRSNNGMVQQNPLIGNYVVDPRATDIGVELIGATTPLKWLVGVGSGTYKGHFDDGSGYSVHAKLWGDPYPGLRSSFSIYHSNHSGDGPGWPENNGTAGDLFVTNRSGGPYAGVFGGGDAPGQLLPGAGQLVTAAQADLTWRRSPLELYGYFGWVQDADINGDQPGSPKESWFYYAAEGIYNITDRLYLAARYSGAAASSIDDHSSDGFISRIAMGGGYWFFDTVLIKMELVYQQLHGFNQSDGEVCGVDSWRDPSFYGAITEASFGF